MGIAIHQREMQEFTRKSRDPQKLGRYLVNWDPLKLVVKKWTLSNQKTGQHWDVHRLTRLFPHSHLGRFCTVLWLRHWSTWGRKSLMCDASHAWRSLRLFSLLYWNWNVYLYIYTNTWIYVHIYMYIYIHIAPFPTMSFQSQQINSRDVASSLPLRCALNHSPKPSDMSRPRAQKGQPWQTQSSGARKPHREAWKLHPWLSRYVSENEGTPSSKNHHFPWGNPWFWGVSPFSGRVHEGPSS